MEVSASALEAIHQTFHRLEQRWLAPLPDAHVWFGYDPLPIADFLRGVAIAEQATKGRRFLDVGCGIGTKLSLMHVMGWAVAGIDRHAPYVAVARELVPEADVRVADVLETVEFDADLVYMYRLPVAEETARTVERHVVELLAPGTVLFLPTRTPSEGCGMSHLDDHVWVR